MKVILGSESFPPNISGVATATVNLAENLVKSGHEVFVFTPGKTYGNKIDPAFSKYEVYRLKSVVNPFRRGYRITFAPDWAIEKLVRKVNPDIIHLQDPAMIGQALRRVGKKLGIPVIITNHFSLEYALSYVRALNLFRPIFRTELINYLVLFYNKCDAVVTPTETFRRQIEDWGVKVPVRAISNGIEIEKFLKYYSSKKINQIQTKFHLPGNPLVLYLGRIDTDKSIDVLIRAIPEVLSKMDAHFVITGTGGELENLKELVKKLRIEQVVTFIGFVDHNSDDFIGLYKSASLFAIPSTIETQSIVTLEAMSSGLPVVAANAGALPELVHNSKNGFLFEPGDSKEAAEKILKILKNPKMARLMSKESVRIAMTHQMNRAFGEMLDLYKEVIEKNKVKKQS